MKTMLNAQFNLSLFLFSLLTLLTGILTSPLSVRAQSSASTSQQFEITAGSDAPSAGLHTKATTSIGLMDTTGMLAAPTIRMNRGAQKFVADYLMRNEADLREIRRRSDPYFTKIDAVFRQHSLPLQLKYLAVIESDLNTAAVSRVGAAGLWQFMPRTARYLGLKVSGRTDERKHLKKSTIAAAQYVKTLYQQFDDWLLVIAAYNSGAGPVLTAIKKSGSRDFWVLQQYLPAETRAHVKRYIGAHYFFEAGGSLTTLTKRETAAYLAALSEHRESMKVIGEIRSGITEDGQGANREVLTVAK